MKTCISSIACLSHHTILSMSYSVGHSPAFQHYIQLLLTLNMLAHSFFLSCHCEGEWERSRAKHLHMLCARCQESSQHKENSLERWAPLDQGPGSSVTATLSGDAPSPCLALKKRMMGEGTEPHLGVWQRGSIEVFVWHVLSSAGGETGRWINRLRE